MPSPHYTPTLAPACRALPSSGTVAPTPPPCPTPHPTPTPALLLTLEHVFVTGCRPCLPRRQTLPPADYPHTTDTTRSNARCCHTRRELRTDAGGETCLPPCFGRRQPHLQHYRPVCGISSLSSTPHILLPPLTHFCTRFEPIMSALTSRYLLPAPRTLTAHSYRRTLTCSTCGVQHDLDTSVTLLRYGFAMPAHATRTYLASPHLR